MYILSVIFIIVDQIVKNILMNNMNMNEVIEVVPNFFNLHLTLNTGAAFSILEEYNIILIFISIISIIFIYFSFIKNKKISKYELIIYNMIFGGIIGNLIDRVIHSGVIDYLSFKLNNYLFPIFNFADILIVIGFISLSYIIIKGDKYENRS